MQRSLSPSAVRYFVQVPGPAKIPGPSENTGETKAKSRPNQGTRLPALWQSLSTMTDRLAALASAYRATCATALMCALTTQFLPAAALTLAVLAYEITRYARASRSPRPSPRFTSAYAVAAVGGGYHGVALVRLGKPVFGPKRSDRHAALTDLHRLLEELDRHASN